MSINDTEKNDPSPETISEALEKFWKSGGDVPDYYGFSLWFDDLVGEAKEISIVPTHMYSVTSVSRLHKFWLELPKIANDLGISIDNNGPRIIPEKFGKPEKKYQSKLKALNKAKLILKFLSDQDERSIDFIVEVEKQGKIERVASINDASIPNESQAAIRGKFFQAIQNEDFFLCYKMLGKLREEKHDLDEVEFLQATALFHSEKFREAIASARKVSPKAPDSPKAHYLILECFGFLGEIEKIFDELVRQNTFNYPDFFLLYVLQLCIMNSPDNDKIKKFGQQIKIELEKRPHKNLGNTIFPFWNRYSCGIATRYVEAYKETLDQEYAKHETNSAPISDDEFYFSWNVERLILALMIDNRFSEILQSGTPVGACKKIVSCLVNHSEYSIEDFVQALRTQWRLGEQKSFLNNIMGNLDRLDLLADQDSEQLITWAYVASKSFKRDKASRTLLKRFPKIKPNFHHEEISHMTARRGLSPNGKMLLESALNDFKTVENSKKLFRDCGMISLGFYRILELEYNKKLILPCLSSDLLKQIKADLEEMDEQGQTSKLKKASDYWFKTIQKLSDGLENGRGLELGSLEIFLSKITSLKGPDRQIKSRFKDGILLLLTEEGQQALENGKIITPIKPEFREKFRNPPAHTRFLDFTTADECKSFVIKSLEALISYTAISKG